MALFFANAELFSQRVHEAIEQSSADVRFHPTLGAAVDAYLCEHSVDCTP